MIRVVPIDATRAPRCSIRFGGIAVIARNTGTAIQARKAVKIEWEDGPHAGYDSADYRAGLEKSARKTGQVVRNEGNRRYGASRRARMEAGYYLPHIAHASMEPPAATARIARACEVWGCFQSPQAARD